MPLFIKFSISRVHMEVMKAITWFVFVRECSNITCQFLSPWVCVMVRPVLFPMTFSKASSEAHKYQSSELPVTFGFFLLVISTCTYRLSNKHACLQVYTHIHATMFFIHTHICNHFFIHTLHTHTHAHRRPSNARCSIVFRFTVSPTFVAPGAGTHTHKKASTVS